MNVEHDQSKWNILPDYLPVTKESRGCGGTD